MYGTLSFVASFLNKKIQQNYGSVSPLNLMMFQVSCGIILAFIMMFAKGINKPAFDKLANIGVEVPHMSTVAEHS